jgi:hypothetical protein
MVDTDALRHSCRKKHAKVLLLATALAVACQHQRRTADEPSANLAAIILAKPINREAIVFNWSRGSGDLRNHVMASAGNAMDRNRGIHGEDDLPPGGMQGYGLYVAPDPVSTSLFGTELSCLLVVAQATIVSKEADARKSTLLERIVSQADLLPYVYGNFPFPAPPEAPYGIPWAAVIRNPQAIDFARSAKFSLQEVGATRGISAAKIAQGREALQAGNSCKALSVYEGEYGSFIYSLAAAFAEWQEVSNVQDLPLKQIVQAPGEKMPEIAAAIESIAADQALLRELQDSSLLDANLPKDKAELQIENLLLKALGQGTGGFLLGIDPSKPEEQLKRIQLLRRVISASGILKLENTGDSPDDFERDICRGFAAKIMQWKAAHPDEVQFVKEVWQRMQTVSLYPVIKNTGADFW